MKSLDRDEMLIKHHEKMQMLCVIQNCCTLACFTILALIFHLWWVVFFTVIFWTSVNINKKGE